MNASNTLQNDPTPVSPDHEPAMFGAEPFTDEEYAAFDEAFGGDEYDPDDHGSCFTLSDSQMAMLGMKFSAPNDTGGLAAVAEALQDPEKPKQKAADVIAETLKAMPMAQREEIVKELYGIGSSFPPPNYHINEKSTSLQYTPQDEDDPIFIGQKLEEMEEHLNRIRSSSSWNMRLAAIELAESQNIEFVKNAKFRLKFIRADRYDSKRAAARYIRYFDLKLELFGEEALTRPITMKDLKSQDRDMLKKGWSQILPVRDRAGRAVICNVLNGQTYETPESLMRLYFYFGDGQDEQTDKRGFVQVWFKIKDFKFKKSTRAFGGCLYMSRLLTDFPVRVDASHKFLELENSKDLSSQLMHKVVDYVVGIMVPEIRARTVVHPGTFKDWEKELMSFGIPLDVIPITYNYKIKTKNHQEYLSMRIKAEEMMARNPLTNSDNLITLPTRSDVLLGKGKPIQFSSGNQRLMTIIDGYLDQYHNKCSKQEKTDLTFEIVRMLKDSGVRFLSKDSGIWLEVTDDLARGKISYMFRHQRGRTPSANGNTGVVRQAPTGEVVTTGATAPETNDNKRVKVGA